MIDADNALDAVDAYFEQAKAELRYFIRNGVLENIK